MLHSNVNSVSKGDQNPSETKNIWDHGHADYQYPSPRMSPLVYNLRMDRTTHSGCMIYNRMYYRTWERAGPKPKTGTITCKTINLNHKSVINTKKDKAVAAHFNQPGHSSSDLRFLPFEVVHGDETLLSSREQYWIKKKRTFELGINRQK